MSTGLIVTLIMSGILVMVGAAIIAQSVENARKQRQLQITVIQQRIRHLSRIINGVPNPYMTATLRQFIIGLLYQSCSAMLALDAKQSAARTQLQQLEALKKKVFPNELDALKPPFDDLITGQEIRNQIKSLVNIIVEMNKDGTLDKPSAVKYVNQGKIMFELISIDIALIGAQNAEKKESTLKVALDSYSNCLRKLLKINTQSEFTQRISYLQSKVQQLKERLKTQRDKAAALVAAAQPKENELDPDRDWQMKHDYE
ncbi:MAG: hypothetical protein ACJAWL_002142 [Motiliproteus sp.]|jgi:hypothetical protein